LPDSATAATPEWKVPSHMDAFHTAVVRAIARFVGLSADTGALVTKGNDERLLRSRSRPRGFAGGPIVNGGLIDTSPVHRERSSGR